MARRSKSEREVNPGQHYDPPDGKIDLLPTNSEEPFHLLGFGGFQNF